LIKIYPIVLAAALVAGVANAEEPGKTLRLIGEAPTAADPTPTKFVIDAMVTKGDDAFQSKIDGWFAAVSTDPNFPASASGEIEGTCVQSRCALTVSLERGKLGLTGDLIGAAGPVVGKFVVTEDGDAPKAEGPVTFTPFADTVPGLGELAKPGSITTRPLNELLLWNASQPAFGNDEDEPLSDSERENLATWQSQNQRPGNGLVMVGDVELLRSQTETQRKAVGWTVLGDAKQGWTAGYPATLLPKASVVGAEHRFASADGKATLVIAIDPPMSREDFDALVEKLTADNPAHSHEDYTRTNDEMQISFVEGGRVYSSVYHRREGGLARLVFSYPSGADAYDHIDVVIGRSLHVTDDLKAAP
jgi:hypothetical protein